MDSGNLIPLIVAFTFLAASPGPANYAVATVSMNSGRKNGLIFGFGLAIGLAFWGVIAATGLGAVLQASEYALFALKILGGCYLIWLAFQTAKSAANAEDQTVSAPRLDGLFYRGLLLNLSNPKVVGAWMAVLSMGLDSGDNAIHIIIATSICAIIGWLNYVVHTLAFSNSHVMAIHKHFRRWIESVVATLFSLSGLGLLKSAFDGE